jgi:hypothetical protein
MESSKSVDTATKLVLLQEALCTAAPSRAPTVKWMMLQPATRNLQPLHVRRDKVSSSSLSSFTGAR